MFLRSARRSGATVAELAIALLVAGTAAALGATLLLAAERRSRRDSQAVLAAQTVREAMHLLSSEISSARWDAVAVRGDTALDLHVHVGVSVACVASADILVLPAAATSRGDPFSVWRSPPEAGDFVAMWDGAGAGAWVVTTADSVTSSGSGAGCASGSPFRSISDSLALLPVTRIRLAAPVTAGVAPGAPVRVFRSVRWMLYRGGDSRWWLGQRRCSRAGCGAAQSVAGPLAPPADSGLRFSLGIDGGVSVSVRAAQQGAPTIASLREFTIRGHPRVTP